MLSEWMKVMLEEIARKREDAERGRTEQARRAAENRSVSPAPGPRKDSRPVA